ncbi:MAG: electron transfer flavoprotein subunit alpha/FixB family protein [Saprospiraceae bacterium]|nr:electron transfer flavoprotein subunit alpha/FixB family protein [Saprospiraceae bacterium]
MIIVFLEHKAGQIKKLSLEALEMAHQLASTEGISYKAMVIGNEVLSPNPGNYGAKELIRIATNEKLSSDQIASVCFNVVQSLQPKYFIAGLSTLMKGIGGQIAIKTQSSLISGVSAFRRDSGKSIFKKSVFSGKAFAELSPISDKTVLTVMANCFNSTIKSEELATENTMTFGIPSAKIQSIETRLIQGKTPLTEAAVVVSAGRGLKDPSNWGMIEELADLLGATTACSRPVADVGWRPHHEHVGQTGIAIRPNVYIAIGISGAIQHLAGVNNSRKILVINKDPEAPFFKAADYGVCGDLFEVVPKLNQAIKKLKN